MPVPPGATTDINSWGKNLQRDGWSRSLVWRRFGPVHGISVDIDGRQESDGSFTRHISLWGVDDGGELTSSQARQTAAFLTEAANELDRLRTST